MNTYKLRAECPRDIAEMIFAVRIEHLDYQREDIDVVATFTSPWSLAAIKEAIAKIEDGHVMLETVALEVDYTGER